METDVRTPFRRAAVEVPPLDGARLALVVVDMVYFDAHPDRGEGRTARRLGVLHAFDPYFARLRAAIPRMQRLLAAAREKGIEVVHVRVAEATSDSRDAGWKQLARGLAVPKDSREAELLEEVAPEGDEIVVSKSSSGVFGTTNLDRLLRNLGVDTLVPRPVRIRGRRPARGDRRPRRRERRRAQSRATLPARRVRPVRRRGQAPLDVG